MKPDDPIKLVAELLDLPLLDKDERYCGIVDDVEFSGAPGKRLALEALLVGPGAYQGRLPSWMYWLVTTTMITNSDCDAIHLSRHVPLAPAG